MGLRLNFAHAQQSPIGNAIATPAVVATLDPSYPAVAFTAYVLPCFVAWLANWQKRRGVTPEHEEAFYESGGISHAPESVTA